MKIDHKIFSSQYEAHLRNGSDGISPTLVFDNSDAGQKRWADMKKVSKCGKFLMNDL